MATDPLAAFGTPVAPQGDQQQDPLASFGVPVSASGPSQSPQQPKERTGLGINGAPLFSSEEWESQPFTRLVTGPLAHLVSQPLAKTFGFDSPSEYMEQWAKKVQPQTQEQLASGSQNAIVPGSGMMRGSAADLMRMFGKFADFAESPEGLAHLALSILTEGASVPVQATYFASQSGSKLVQASGRYMSDPSPNNLQDLLETGGMTLLMASGMGKTGPGLKEGIAATEAEHPIMGKPVGEAVTEGVTKGAEAAGKAAEAVTSAGEQINRTLRPPDVEGAPAKLARNLGATSRNPETTLATYEQIKPHLAEIERTGTVPHDFLGRVQAEPLFKAVRERVDNLGAPMRDAVEMNTDETITGDAKVYNDIRGLLRRDLGRPDALELTDSDATNLRAIAAGTGPFTVAEADSVRQYANARAGTLDPARTPALIPKWKRAEAYTRNNEYSTLKARTGIDIDHLQSDRSRLIDVQNAALRRWASELKMQPTGLAQSLGVPFGFSRIVMGAASGNIPEVLGGAAEVGAVTSWRALASQQRALGKTLHDLGRSDLVAPNYAVPPGEPPGGGVTAGPTQPTLPGIGGPPEPGAKPVNAPPTVTMQPSQPPRPDSGVVPNITPPKGIVPKQATPSSVKLFNLSPEELESGERLAKTKEGTIETRLFGDQGAKDYGHLQRIANSTTRSFEETDAASRKIAEMEGKLTPEQENELFGIGQTEPTSEQYRDFRRALGEIGGESAEELGRSMRWAITKIGDPKAITDPATLPFDRQVAYAQLRHGFEMASQEGWNPNEVLQAAIKGAGERFEDPEDAKFMLSAFVKSTPK